MERVVVVVVGMFVGEDKEKERERERERRERERERMESGEVGERVDFVKVDVVDLEERMKYELRVVMFLGEYEEVCDYLGCIEKEG